MVFFAGWYCYFSAAGLGGKIIYDFAVEGFSNGGRLLVHGRGTYSEH